MKRYELTPTEAAVILFGRDTLTDADFDPMQDQFRSGADIAESLAAHFLFSGDDYEAAAEELKTEAAIAESDKLLPDGTRLRCPECGSDTFGSWYYQGYQAHGAHVEIRNGERVEDDSDIYDSSSGDDVKTDDCYSCAQCSFFGPMSSLVAPGEAMTADEAEQEPGARALTAVFEIPPGTDAAELEARLMAIAAGAGLVVAIHGEDLTASD